MIDFINIYMPAYADLAKDEVLDVRGRLESYVHSSFPELETSPATVTGDLIITPQAYEIAAIERGLDNFMSDLDLGNVANDVIYNCEFVERYLENFSAYPKNAELAASGVVRLVFNTNKDYVLDRSTRFSFNGGVYSMYLPCTGPLYIMAAGSSSTVQHGNCVKLIDSGSNAYFVDVPVVGNSGALTVTASTSGLVNKDNIPELGAITSLVDFSSGEVSYSLPQLAARTRNTIYAASLNTRMGAIRYVTDNCPFVESVYAVKNGDREMLRDFTGVGVVGCLDLYVRSKSYVFTEVQRVKLYKDATTGKFSGEFPYTGQIYHMESVTNEAVQDVDDIPHTITASDAEVPGRLPSYTVNERLFLEVDDAVGPDGASLYDTSTDADGRVYSMFTVTYQTDPAFKAIHDMVTNPDYVPINTSIQVKGFIPVIISRFEVSYVKAPGVVPLLDEAAADIKAYMAGLGAPDTYSDAEIARIMAEAGAKYTKGVSVVAKVQWSVADKLQTADGTKVDIPGVPVITTSAGLRVTYPASKRRPGDMYACSPRNIRYYFLEGALSFKEIREM